MNALDSVSALLAALGAGGIGFTLGVRRQRGAKQDLRAEAEMWRSLANAATAALERARATASGRRQPTGEQPPGPPNALASLRTRLRFGRGELAQALGIPIPEVEALEHTPLGLLEIGKVASYVGALGCRLDVVAQHVDGEAVFLEYEVAP